MIDGARVLITGGTGSLGTALVSRLLSKHYPEQVIVFSRDEAKQQDMKRAYNDKRLKLIIGDMRDFTSVFEVVQNTDIIFNAAAMKHVPVCEAQPWQTVCTNVIGTQNLIWAVTRLNTVKAVVGVSSDKGCHPVNVYGATKFLQEKMLLGAVKTLCDTRFVCVCYGNVMASRGSVIPIFQQQIREGGPVTITNRNMTRFLISLDQAVDTLLTALDDADNGEVYVPILPAASVGDIADVLIDGRNIEVTEIGSRKGEKMHEVLITEQEMEYVEREGNYYVISSHQNEYLNILGEYCSKDHLIPKEELKSLFERYGICTRTKVS